MLMKVWNRAGSTSTVMPGGHLAQVNTSFFRSKHGIKYGELIPAFQNDFFDLRVIQYSPLKHILSSDIMPVVKERFIANSSASRLDLFSVVALSRPSSLKKPVWSEVTQKSGPRIRPFSIVIGTPVRKKKDASNLLWRTDRQHGSQIDGTLYCFACTKEWLHPGCISLAAVQGDLLKITGEAVSLPGDVASSESHKRSNVRCRNISRRDLGACELSRVAGSH